MKKIKLEVKNISVEFEDKKVIEDISLKLCENELVCILGTSGVGKTTLFNVIAGLLEPSEGEVDVYKRQISSNAPPARFLLKNLFVISYSL